MIFSGGWGLEVRTQHSGETLHCHAWCLLSIGAPTFKRKCFIGRISHAPRRERRIKWEHPTDMRLKIINVLLLSHTNKMFSQKFAHHAFRKSQKATFPYQLHSIMISEHSSQIHYLKKQQHTLKIINCHKQNKEMYRITVSFLNNKSYLRQCIINK